jgi:DivIVA domain-containing protein
VELDRHAIERRDFPTSRRGYDPASVDAHLRGVANRLEELARTHADGAPTLASAAGTQVQSILASAETLAADITREASAEAARAREDAVAAAREHITAVGAAATALLERVTAVEQEVGALVGRAQSAATQLVHDLETLEREVGTLYDAASAHRAGAAEAGERERFPIPTEVPGAAASAHEPPSADVPAASVGELPASDAPPRDVPASEAPSPASDASHGRAPEPAAAPPRDVPASEGDDVDGARLIALNMALNGEPREETDRYLAQNFTLADRAKLIEEVYAAVEV